MYDQSNLPLLTSSWLVAWLLDWAGNTTSDGAIFAACQYVGFFFSEYCVGANLSSVNGPVPTGLVLVNFAGSGTDDHRCSGTIGVLATTPAKGTLGALNVTVTSLPDVATPVICAQTPLPSSAGYFLIRLNVNTTSAGVNGVPSLHFTFCRIVKSSVVGSVNLWPVARNGVNVPSIG